jgi:hypothetical protein
VSKIQFGKVGQHGNGKGNGGEEVVVQIQNGEGFTLIIEKISWQNFYSIITEVQYL